VTSRGDGSFNLPTAVSVPDVRGGSASAASTALQAAGLVRGQLRGVVDNTCNTIGLVVRQSPGAGTQVDPGTAVDLWIGQRPPLACP
jgi:serine/threonine-protein kinase